MINAHDFKQTTFKKFTKDDHFTLANSFWGEETCSKCGITQSFSGHFGPDGERLITATTMVMAPCISETYLTNGS